MAKSNKHYVLGKLDILLTARLLSIMLKLNKEYIHLKEPRVIS